MTIVNNVCVLSLVQLKLESPASPCFGRQIFYP